MHPIVECRVWIARCGQHECELQYAHDDGANKVERLAQVQHDHYTFMNSQVCEIKYPDHIYPHSKIHLQGPDYWNRKSPEANIGEDVTR